MVLVMTPKRFLAYLCKPVLVAHLAVGVGAGQTVTLSPDVVAALRAHAEAMRMAAFPPPPPNVRELQWSELSPRGYRPQIILDRLGVDRLTDDDAKSHSILAEVRHEWQQAPSIQLAPDGLVRVAGFAVMLDEGTAPVRKVLLVPYYGACIHSPPPPVNQEVLVTLDQPLPRNMYQFPIWITGQVKIKVGSTQHGRVLYQMSNAKWEPYPYPKYPMPMYRLPQ